MESLKFVPIHNWDNIIAIAIKEKLNEAGGELDLKSGTSKFTVAYANDASGILVTSKSEEKVLAWDVFFATVQLLRENEGKAIKGDATKDKLGGKLLPLDSVEGYVASVVFGKKRRSTVEKNVHFIGAILECAGISKNGRGYLELSENYR